MKHDIKLPRNALRILIPQIMNPEGWCKNVKQYTAVGSFLDNEVVSQHIDLDPESPKDGESKKDYISRIKPWLDDMIEFQVSEAERDAIKSCLNHGVTSSRLPGSIYTLKLLEAFGVE